MMPMAAICIDVSIFMNGGLIVDHCLLKLPSTCTTNQTCEVGLSCLQTCFKP